MISSVVIDSREPEWIQNLNWFGASKSISCMLHTIPSLYIPSIQCHLYNWSPMSFAHTRQCCSIFEIIQSCYPFKVAYMIILFVFIYMINTSQIIRIWNKRFSNKSMNDEAFLNVVFI